MTVRFDERESPAGSSGDNAGMTGGPEDNADMRLREETCKKAGNQVGSKSDMYEWKDILCVTNRSLCRRPLEEQMEIVCAHHPRAVILREKDLSEADYEALARRILPICTRYSVPLIPHFYPEAARILGIRRIHLPLWRLRKLTDSGHDPADGFKNYFHMIGCSVHSVEEAREAVGAGATCLIAGHIFETDCKKGLPPRGLDFLRAVCRSVPVPVYAIGGIRLDPEQLKLVKRCGAAGACIMSGLMTL